MIAALRRAVALVGAVLAALTVAFLTGRHGAKNQRRAEDAERKSDAVSEIRQREQNAGGLDDETLSDRLTRNRNR